MSNPTHATRTGGDTAPNPNTHGADSTSASWGLLPTPAGMVAVTVWSSARGNMPLRYPDHPECDEDLHYEDWCVREVNRLREQGRVAMVVYGSKAGVLVCRVIADQVVADLKEDEE